MDTSQYPSLGDPKQSIKPGWAQLALLDVERPPIVHVAPRIRTALRCPLCGAALVHVVGECCECPQCGMEIDL